jgi:hypothetical protein
VGARWRLGSGAFSFGGSSVVTDEDGRDARHPLDDQPRPAGRRPRLHLGRRLVACGGARAGVRVGLGAASGPFIFQQSTASTLAPTVGPAGRLALRLGRSSPRPTSPCSSTSSTPALAVDGLFSAGSATPRLEALGWLGAGVEWP